MAFTRTWNDLLTIVKPQVRNIPTTWGDPTYCDLVSSRISQVAEWAPQVTTIATGTIPLVDGQQDYDPPKNIHQLGEQMYLVRTDTSPQQYQNLDVVPTLPVDLVVRSPYTVRNISLEAGDGKLRLETAVSIPTGTTWEIQGQYQFNPSKITSVNQPCWFDDKYTNVALEGLLYWYFKLSNDDRTAQQYTIFEAAINQMKVAEDLSNGESKAFPSDPIGITSANYVGPADYIFGP